MDFIFHLISTSLTPFTFLLMVTAVLVGIAFGAVPGLGGPLAVALALPLTFTLSPTQGLLILGALYMGSEYGGVIPAILLNIPGTAEAASSTFDGYPMAQQGRAKEALQYSIISAVIGGLFGSLVLFAFAPFLADLALHFGPPQIFMLSLAGLSVTGMISSGEVTKGIFAAAFGMLLSFVGQDVLTGADRLTFGFTTLRAGIPLVPVVIGLFAISEMIGTSNSGAKLENNTLSGHSSLWSVLKEIKSKPWLVLKSCVLGLFIGLVPGTGGSIATFIMYAEAKRSSKQKSSFGHGNPEGLIAPQVSGTSVVGGAMVPLLALGIPGSTTTAVMYGGLTINGLVPGPSLFSNHPDIVYSFMAGLVITVFIMGVIGIFGIPLLAKITKIKMNLIVPFVCVISLVGAYTVRNNFSDVIIAAIFGMIGFIFRKLKVPLAPIALGLILGPIVEKNLRYSVVVAHAKQQNILGFILLNPTSFAILAIAFLMVISTVIARRGA